MKQLRKRLYDKATISKTTSDMMSTIRKKSTDLATISILKRKFYSVELRDEARRRIKGEEKEYFDPSGRERSRLVDIRSMLDDIGHVESYYDIGASEGNITKVVRGYLRVKNVKVFDINVDNRIEDGIEYIHNEYDKIDIGDSTADLVTTFMSLHHFEDLTKMLSEIRRVLKHGGHLIIREHDAENEYLVSFFDLTHLIYSTVFSDETTSDKFVKEFFTRYKTKERWIEVIETAGFNLVRWTYPMSRVKKGNRDFTNAFYALFVSS